MERNGIKKSGRYSSIELMKVFGICLIVLNHVVQTLGKDANYAIDLEAATSSPVTLLLIMFRYFGALGNTIFFVCSAWFLIDSKKNKIKKLFLMEGEVWTVSVLFLFICMTLMHIEGRVLPVRYIIKSLFPTISRNNWYITTYMIFYMFYPFLNRMLAQTERFEHLMLSVISNVLFVILPWLQGKDPTVFFVWCCLYIAISYIKQYHAEDLVKHFKKIAGGG